MFSHWYFWDCQNDGGRGGELLRWQEVNGLCSQSLGRSIPWHTASLMVVTGIFPGQGGWGSRRENREDKIAHRRAGEITDPRRKQGPQSWLVGKNWFWTKKKTTMAPWTPNAEGISVHVISVWQPCLGIADTCLFLRPHLCFSFLFDCGFFHFIFPTQASLGTLGLHCSEVLLALLERRESLSAP